MCMRIFYDFPVMPVKGTLEYSNGGTSSFNTFPESSIACSFTSVCALKLKLFLPKYFVLIHNIGSVFIYSGIGLFSSLTFLLGCHEVPLQS